MLEALRKDRVWAGALRGALVGAVARYVVGLVAWVGMLLAYVVGPLGLALFVLLALLTLAAPVVVAVALMFKETGRRAGLASSLAGFLVCALLPLPRVMSVDQPPTLIDLVTRDANGPTGRLDGWIRDVKLAVTRPFDPCTTRRPCPDAASGQKQSCIVASDGHGMCVEDFGPCCRDQAICAPGLACVIASGQTSAEPTKEHRAPVDRDAYRCVPTSPATRFRVVHPTCDGRGGITVPE